MTKYIVIIDHHNTLQPVQLKARTIYEAMDEAEAKMDEFVYLMKIAESNDRGQHFTEKLVNRHNGWHTCSRKHSEAAATWKKVKIGSFVDFEIENVDYDPT